MSTKQGKIGHHRFHGDVRRFEVISRYIAKQYKPRVRFIADVAGGQGMLSRILMKKFNFQSEVIDPREYVLLGVPHRRSEYTAEMADYYDLIIGLHPDQALRDVVASALIRPVIVIPCCNFWDMEQKLGRNALLKTIKTYYDQHHVSYKVVEFEFEGPKNIGLVSEPPNH